MSLNLSRVTNASDNLTAPEPAESQTLDQPSALWICIYFPDISLNATIDIVDAHDHDSPVLVVENIKERQVVHTASDAALNLGIMSGMPLNAAYALCHKPNIIPRSTEKEMMLLEEYASLISHFTPTYSLSPPDSLLLEVSGSTRLFGGIRSLYQSIQKAVNSSAIISLSPSPSASRLLAHTGHKKAVLRREQLKQSLSPIKIEHIDLDEKPKSQLLKCGIHTLGDLWRLPRTDLGKRFGISLIQLMDKLLAIEPNPQTPAKPKLTFSTEITVSAQNNNKAILCVAAKELLIRAQYFLKQHASVTEKVHFELRHEKYDGHDHENTTLFARSQKASHDPLRFLPQFTEQLTQLDLAQPVVSIQLTISKVISGSRFSDDLFSPGKKDNQDWEQLMDIIKSRLGDHLLYGITTFPDHRPERTWQQKTVCRTPMKKTSDDSETSECIHLQRPLWLLKKPRKINIDMLTSASVYDIERLESGWWEQQSIRRDYHVIHFHKAAKAWVYLDLSDHHACQNSLNTIEQKQAPGSNWYLHGLFG